MLVKKKVNLKGSKKRIYRAIVHINVSFNNNIVSITDMKGNVIAWASSGLCGFKGARKGTPFASKTTTELALKKALEFGVKQVQVSITGVGSGREMAIRSVQNSGMNIFAIKDVTKLPHNGCRPSKKRRV